MDVSSSSYLVAPDRGGTRRPLSSARVIIAQKRHTRLGIQYALRVLVYNLAWRGNLHTLPLRAGNPPEKQTKAVILIIFEVRSIMMEVYLRLEA